MEAGRAQGGNVPLKTLMRGRAAGAGPWARTGVLRGAGIERSWRREEKLEPNEIQSLAGLKSQI